MNREDEIRLMLRNLFRNARNRLAGHRMILFGSRARGGGDLDPISMDDKLKELPTLFRIDWIDLARASEEMCQSALIDCEILYEP